VKCRRQGTRPAFTPAYCIAIVIETGLSAKRLIALTPNVARTSYRAAEAKMHGLRPIQEAEKKSAGMPGKLLPEQPDKRKSA